MLLVRFLLRCYNLFLSPDKLLARRVRDMTGFVPARLSIFRQAFSHKSSHAAAGSGYAQTNNERLEYLGDAVLGTVVAEYLFKKYPDADEGFLTKMRSKIVKRKSLNAIGDAMGLDVMLAEYNNMRLSSSMLGNAVEALVGAVYLEKGYRATKRFIIRRMLKNYVDMHELETVDDNYKSQLLEYCQKAGKPVTYRLLTKYKQERRDRFKVAVVFGGDQISTADDFNKKAAEQLASLRALEHLGVVTEEKVSAGGKRKRKSSAAPAGERPNRKPRGATVGGSRGGDPAERPAKSKRTGGDTARVKPAAQPGSGRAAALGAASGEHATGDAATARASTPPASAPEDAGYTSRDDEPLALVAEAATPPNRPSRKRGRRRPGYLSRCVRHAVDGAAAALSAVAPPAGPPSGKVNGRAPAEAAPVDVPLPDTTPPDTTPQGSPPPKKSTPAARPQRRRRPVPLRLLNPLVADLAAVLHLDDGPAAAAAPGRRPPRRKPRRRAATAATATAQP